MTDENAVMVADNPDFEEARKQFQFEQVQMMLECVVHAHGWTMLLRAIAHYFGDEAEKHRGWDEDFFSDTSELFYAIMNDFVKRGMR